MHNTVVYTEANAEAQTPYCYFAFLPFEQDQAFPTHPIACHGLKDVE